MPESTHLAGPAPADRPPTAGDLVDRYRPGSSFFFASPRQVLLAEGIAVGLPARDTDLAGYVSTMLAAVAGDVPEPVAVGAIPFADPAAAHLVVPAAVHRAAPVGVDWRPPPEPAGPPAGIEVRAVPEPEGYLRGVERALARMADGELAKVVLARSLHVGAPSGLDLRRVLANLATLDPRGYTFAADLPGGRTLLGASPELLVSRVGDRVVANPLAGSAARSPEPAQDARRAATLFNSRKDRHEHALVVEAVAEALRPYCIDLRVPARPAVVPTGTMWHLSTQVTGTLADPSTTALTLATALHPTPAVCGTPPGPARDMIAEVEPFPRGFYTGTVGWVDADGDGEWVIAIRCAEADERTLRLYAGAGIVPGSRPADELAETSAKFRTLLLAMGLPDAA
ncbi:isochorismate synthase DhbC [Polymorphospora sp. NPDC051019]|uniref:isochorismate synthase DhbC n=1 Tax=Polymorphospora sp. NPDC051019 TaxID=3155725 RepID=UPI0034483105